MSSFWVVEVLPQNWASSRGWLCHTPISSSMGICAASQITMSKVQATTDMQQLELVQFPNEGLRTRVRNTMGYAHQTMNLGVLTQRYNHVIAPSPLANVDRTINTNFTNTNMEWLGVSIGEVDLGEPGTPHVGELFQLHWPGGPAALFDEVLFVGQRITVQAYNKEELVKLLFLSKKKAENLITQITSVIGLTICGADETPCQHTTTLNAVVVKIKVDDVVRYGAVTVCPSHQDNMYHLPQHAQILLFKLSLHRSTLLPPSETTIPTTGKRMRGNSDNDVQDE